MIDLQSDLTDVIARDMTPHIVRVTEKALKTDLWSLEKSQSIEHMLALFRDFDGEMHESSVAATVYSYW
jgi:hypothetical protein